MAGFECLECHNLKTRIFTDVAGINQFCARWAIKPNPVWIEDIEEFGKVRLIWCIAQTSQHKKHGFSPRCAVPKHSVNEMPDDNTEVTITNMDRKPFIERCKYKET